MGAPQRDIYKQIHAMAHDPKDSRMGKTFLNVSHKMAKTLDNVFAFVFVNVFGNVFVFVNCLLQPPKLKGKSLTHCTDSLTIGY